MPLRRAVFLDRDGVINESCVRNGRPYPPQSVAELKIVEGAEMALRRLKSAGFFLVVVTNQPDVARRTQSLDSVEEIHSILRRALPLDEVRVCYHDDPDQCGCRKPKPGMLTESAECNGIDLRSSFMIGDRWRDIEAGRRAGCTTLLIARGYQAGETRIDTYPPNHTVTTLGEATDLILSLTRHTT